MQQVHLVLIRQVILIELKINSNAIAVVYVVRYATEHLPLYLVVLVPRLYLSAGPYVVPASQL